MIRRGIILFVALVGVTAVVAGPRAGLVAKTWELDFEFYDPQRIEVKLLGDSTPTTFWYVVYRVTNRTGQDVTFTPSFRIITDKLETVVAGDGISPEVYDAIAARHKREFPFFATPSKVTGKLMQGGVNARTSAAVFTTFDTRAAGFRVFASGLSGDIERLPNPAFKTNEPESEKNKRFFLLRRTLELDYDLPGDPDTRKYVKPIRRNRQWVLR
jgi:hypothetical protein